MKRFRSSLGVAAATVSFASALSPNYRHGHGAVLPKYSYEPLKNRTPPSLFLDGSTTGSWDGPALHDGTPTRLYSLSLGRVWHNHTENAELTTTVDAQKAARRSWQGRRSLYLSMEDTPLFPGWGTHFAYVYAGTPPQRVSVIVDTGSHFTAFPCSECRGCGSHTDPYWDHTKSSTSNIVSCNNCHGSFRCNAKKRCGFSQKYSEGSSWSAYQVEDVLWVGEVTLEESEKLVHNEAAYAVEFMFGCIESQTGLFKTQLADGIMGMSADKHTLVWQLYEAGKIKERIFSLCFSLTGGTMVLGGYDARLNSPGAEMQYTPTTKDSGWFTIKVEKITLDGVSIAHDPSVFQRGKGTIVDSGTTDTYLPKSVAAGFSKAWKTATGEPYKTCVDNQFCMKLTAAELDALPTLHIHLDGGIEVKVRPQAYMDALGKDNAYAPRIYMEESMGVVLGANVMRDHNVVFDYDNHRVGFAPGMCDYRPVLDEIIDSEAGEPNLSGTAKTAGAEQVEEAVDCVTAKQQVITCDATCPVGLPEPTMVVGHEKWVDFVVVKAQGSGKACPDEFATEIRECSKDCPKGASNPMAEGQDGGDGDGQDVEGEGGERKSAEEAGAEEPVEQVHIPTGISCSLEEELWTDCSADCLQQRYMSADCAKEAEARPCHVGDLCNTSKMGLILAIALTLELDVVEAGDELVEDIVGERGVLWMKSIGTAVSDTVALQLSEVPPGDVEASVVLINPDAVERSENGRAIMRCAAEVIVHLTPKVDNNAANRASSVLNIPSLPEVLTASLKEAVHNGAYTPNAGFSITFIAADRASMFIASNGDAYLPPVNDRLQAAAAAAYPRQSVARTIGEWRVFAALGVLIVGLFSFRARLKHVRQLRSGRGFEEVSQIEMQAHEDGLHGSSAVVGERLGEGAGRSHRKYAGVVRDDT